MKPETAQSIVLAFSVVTTVMACVASNERFVATPPDRASFPVVADLLVHRCGTLDCHGSQFRNLRLYGNEGLRLDPAARPSSKPTTTVAEYDESFLSILALEPELMSAVVSEGGASPDRLTFVRKARGDEHHKGGGLVQAGDEQDVCITSWLAGRTDSAACAHAKQTTP